MIGDAELKLVRRVERMLGQGEQHLPQPQLDVVEELLEAYVALAAEQYLGALVRPDPFTEASFEIKLPEKAADQMPSPEPTPEPTPLPTREGRQINPIVAGKWPNGKVCPRCTPPRHHPPEELGSNGWCQECNRQYWREKHAQLRLKKEEAKAAAATAESGAKDSSFLADGPALPDIRMAKVNKPYLGPNGWYYLDVTNMWVGQFDTRDHCEEGIKGTRKAVSDGD